MNLVNVCPDIPDDWKGGMSAACRLLGIDWKTLDRYMRLGNIKCRTSTGGRRLFSGQEIKRFWREF